MNKPILTPKLFEVIEWTFNTKKAISIPYDMSYLVSASLVLQAGGSEIEAIASILYGSYEYLSSDEVESEFGERVTDILTNLMTFEECEEISNDKSTLLIIGAICLVELREFYHGISTEVWDVDKEAFYVEILYVLKDACVIPYVWVCEMEFLIGRLTSVDSLVR